MWLEEKVQKAESEAKDWEGEDHTLETPRHQSKATVSGRQWGAIGGFRAGERFTRGIIFRVLSLATM